MKSNCLIKRRTEGILEYAVLILFVTGALFSMCVYVKRAVQGNLKEAVDRLGEEYSPETVTNRSLTYNFKQETKETLSGGVSSVTGQSDTTENIELGNLAGEMK